MNNPQIKCQKCQINKIIKEVYKDNLCVNCWDKENPNCKGWKCDICQRLCGKDEQFITMAGKYNSNDPSVYEEFNRKYPYGITYCPECKIKADGKNGKDKEDDREKKEQIKDFTKDKKSLKSLCEDCEQFLSKDFESWEKHKIYAKKHAKTCDHSLSSIRYHNEAGECLAIQSLTNAFKSTLCQSKQCKEVNTPKPGEGCRREQGWNYRSIDKWNDLEPCKHCGQVDNEENHRTPQNNPTIPNIPKVQVQLTTTTLQQVQQYFQANNVLSITCQPNGDLHMIFNTNIPPQIITNEQIASESSSMEKEQKNLWKNYQAWAKANNKTKLDKVTLGQEIKRLESKNNQQVQPTGIPTPLKIVGAILFFSIPIVIIVYVLKSLNTSKKRRY